MLTSARGRQKELSTKLRDSREDFTLSRNYGEGKVLIVEDVLGEFVWATSVSREIIEKQQRVSLSTVPFKSFRLLVSRSLLALALVMILMLDKLILMALISLNAYLSSFIVA